MITSRAMVIYAAIYEILATDDYDYSQRSLRAVRNYDARLPCGPGKIFLDGPDAYVLWLKDDEKFLYRFPNEDTWQKTLNPNNIYGTSCVDNHCYDDTSLFLPQVSDTDEGKYRCRVHYQGSSSVDYVVDLKIVDPTGAPKIYSDNGKEITTPFVGPITLSENITLICEVIVSQTPTTVLWLRNGVIIRRVLSDTPGILRERVLITDARRDELDVLYQCTASNADVTEPFTIGVVVKMYLPPLKVEIRLNNNYDFEVGQPRVVDCVVIGCVPTPTINWYLGDKLLKSTAHKELHDGNYTVSSLTLTASIQDNMHQISCRVHNAYLSIIYEDNVTIHVGYRPRCLLTKQQTIGIVPGEAETIMCLVESAPEPVQVSWVFADSRILYTNAIRVKGRKNHYCSSLTWIPQNEDMGLLYCRAVNKYGEQRSPCVYALNPGGAPQPPNCNVREDDDKKNIICQKGWDGGRTQTVHLEVLTLKGAVVHNASDPCGNFSVPSLEQANLTANVYASNARGRSADTSVDISSLVSPSTAFEKENKFGWSDISFYSIVGAIVVILLITFFVCCGMVGKRKEDDHNTQCDAECEDECLAVIEAKRVAQRKAECKAQREAMREAKRQAKREAKRRAHEERMEGIFHREPDFEREDRLAATTINVHATCQTRCNSRPTPLPDSSLTSFPVGTQVTTQEMYYV